MNVTLAQAPIQMRRSWALVALSARPQRWQ
jgi:hypothetical protein